MLCCLARGLCSGAKMGRGWNGIGHADGWGENPPMRRQSAITKPHPCLMLLVQHALPPCILRCTAVLTFGSPSSAPCAGCAELPAAAGVPAAARCALERRDSTTAASTARAATAAVAPATTPTKAPMGRPAMLLLPPLLLLAVVVPPLPLSRLPLPLLSSP